MLSALLALSLPFAAQGKPRPAVEIRQVDEQWRTVCTFNLTNRSATPINRFVVGDGYRIPTLPSGWLRRASGDLHHAVPGGSPWGWVESIGDGAFKEGYFLSWTGKSSEVVLYPGRQLEFRLVLLHKPAGLRCDRLPWRVEYAPPPPPDPPDLFLELSSLTFDPEEEPIPVPVFKGDVVISNLGPGDALINLGNVFGTLACPSLLNLVARSETGHEYALEFFGVPGFVGGTIAKMNVSIPQGARYTAHGQWRTFPPLQPGTYVVHVEFEGRDRCTVKERLRPLLSWPGRIQSDELKVTIP